MLQGGREGEREGGREGERERGGGGGGGGGRERGCNELASTIADSQQVSAILHYSKIALETTSEGLKSKMFLEGHAHRPP